MRHLLLLLFASILTLSAKPLAALQHAEIYKDQHISGWVMSEKLDGIRGYWDGEALYTKSGKRLCPPQQFIKNFPPFALDGELWSTRQDFEQIQSSVLKHGGSWKEITYNIFEVPSAKGNFFERLEKAGNWFEMHPAPSVRIVTQHPCQNVQKLEAYLDEVVANGGEGVIVKDPYLDYTSGRTSTILKVKKAQDMEGKVITVNTQGNTTVMKSLTLELDNGIRFNLGNGFTDNQRLYPPEKGDLVTFKYYGLTKYGRPKFASFMRIRKE